MKFCEQFKPIMLLLCGWLLAGAPAWAQFPPALANPDLDLQTRGEARASVQLADGSVIIGGRFLTVNGIERGSLVKLLPGGQVDMTWNPDIQGTVHALAVDEANRIYVGGLFNSVGGQSRKNLVRVFSVGEGIADSTWTPEPDGAVNALVVSAGANPRIYAGGEFSQIGGVARQNLARLQAGNGTAVAGWNTPANASVHALTFAVNEAFLYVGGQFTSIGSKARRHVAQLISETGSVQDWDAELESPGWYVEPGVYALAVPHDNTQGVYIGGTFERVKGQVRLGLARVLHPVQAFLMEWTPLPNHAGADVAAKITSIHVANSGQVFVAGEFAQMGFPPSGHVRRGLAKISPGGAVDASWNAQLANSANHVFVGNDGLVLVSGVFLRVQGQPRVGWAALGAGGQIQGITAQLGSSRGFVTNMVRQADGGTIAVGLFDLAQGTMLRQNILRLKPDGSLDQGWQVAINNYPQALAVDDQGRIYVGGTFSLVNGERRRGLARLAATGQLDAGWAPEVGGYSVSVSALLVAPGGRVYVGGVFESIRVAGGSPVPRSNLARLLTSGSGEVDTAFNVPVLRSAGQARVQTLARAADGALFLGGAFDSVAGLLRYNIAKIDPGGSVNMNWSLPADSDVGNLHVGNDGWLYAAGNFSQIGAYLRKGIARMALSGNGLADATWDPAPDSPHDHSIYQLSLSEDWVYVCGWFHSVGALSIEMLARVSRTGNGGADPDWNPAMDDGFCMTILALDDGSVQVGGIFDSVGGRHRVSLVRLAADDEVIFADGFGN